MYPTILIIAGALVAILSAMIKHVTINRGERTANVLEKMGLIAFAVGLLIYK